MRSLLPAPNRADSLLGHCRCCCRGLAYEAVALLQEQLEQEEFREKRQLRCGSGVPLFPTSLLGPFFQICPLGRSHCCAKCCWVVAWSSGGPLQGDTIQPKAAFTLCLSALPWPSIAQQQLAKPRRAEHGRRPPVNNKQAQALTHVPPPTRPPRCPVRSVLLAALRGALTGPFQRLPAVTALFLAEAALVLAHPGAPMYPAVNKYLLRRAVLDLKVSTACTTGAAWQVAHGAESACASGLRPSAGHADVTASLHGNPVHACS